MNPITALLSALGVLSAAYVGLWAKEVIASRRMSGAEQSPATDARFPTAEQIGVGAVSNFFDTLGIGSFATTTAYFRLRRMVPDRVIPGTLNSGHALPTVVQAFIVTAIIPADVLTLLSMIGAAVLGAWLGAGVVAKWSRRKVQIGMALALLAAAAFMFMKQLNLFPAGSEEIGVRGAKLALAIGGNFALGALMTLGIGLYARYVADPDRFRLGYDDMLSATGLGDAAELAGRFGIDVRDEAFWTDSLDVIRTRIAEFEAVAARFGDSAEGR